MKEKIFKQQGTALLVTLLLAGAISAIAFGMTKVTLNEIFVGMKDQEGLEAHYAAQAGIEDALMRFKFHGQASLEMPDGARGGANGSTPEAVRIYLNRPSVAKVNPAVDRPSTNADDYYYDLKVWHKIDCSLNLCEYKLKKDESVLLDTSSASAAINVSWNLYDDHDNLITNLTPEEAKQTGLWYRLSDPAAQNLIDPTGQNRDFFTMLSYFNSSDNVTDPRFVNFALPRGQTAALSIRTAKSLKFKAFMADAISNNSYIKVIITSSVVGGPKTHIESTGHYGDTAKKIEVTVDRESKSIIDVFDYVIYSGAGPLPR